MDFVLYYKGKLKSNGDRQEKNRLRQYFSPQIKGLWDQEPLKTLWFKKYASDRSRFVKSIGKRDFVPLVSQYLRLLAKLHITFLRQEPLGRIVHGGDIDNRMKTLLDGLRMPLVEQELVDDAEAEQGTPVYCLLEDDALVTSLHVETARLLIEDVPEDVVLLLKVNIVPRETTWDNLGF